MAVSIIGTEGQGTGGTWWSWAVDGREAAPAEAASALRRGAPITDHALDLVEDLIPTQEAHSLGLLGCRGGRGFVRGGECFEGRIYFDDASPLYRHSCLVLDGGRVVGLFNERGPYWWEGCAWWARS